MAQPALLAAQEFSSACRRWRQHRKLSQLELALAANVSQRHVSWLETGKSQPSREMVIRLSEAMEIPLRERNQLLQSAGFSALYSEKALEEPGMEPILHAVRHVLAHHDPYPAVAVDRFWNVKMRNEAASMLFGLAGDVETIMESVGESGDFNIALLTLHPEGLRRHIANWDQLAPDFIRRLRSEALVSGDPEMHERFERFIEAAGPTEETESASSNLLPILPLELDLDGQRFSLFSIITTIGTPQDITTDELRVEAFYPADEETERFFEAIATQGRSASAQPA